MELNLNINYIDRINHPQFDAILRDFKKSEGVRTSVRENNCILLSNGEIQRSFNPHSCESAIYLGAFLNIWGHCITDNLKRFWFLLTPEAKKLRNQGFKLVCTLYEDSKFCKNFIELISYFGLKEEDINIINKPTSFKTLIIPQDSLNHYHWYYQEFKDTIDYIVSQVPIDCTLPKKLYFSRTKLSDNGKRDFGEFMIEDAFRKMGYSIVFPEKHSLREQLTFLKNCDSFAATDGSVAHNSMFCRDGIECIVISKMVGAIPYQYSIMGMKQFKSYYIDSHLSIFNVFAPWHGPFYMYISDNLVRFCKDRGFDIPWKFSIILYLMYFIRCIYEFIRYRLKVKLNKNSEFYLNLLKISFHRRFKIIFSI